ncbi:MAG TPA: GtrA family protein [Steroidobacteraceae bacterium]|nr:GtrA family protein [Steroidobacteraceae bacterium]
MRALKFGLVGVANTATDFTIFALLTLVGQFAAASANLLSYSCGIGLSFWLNRTWTFRDRSGDRPLSRLTAFVLGSLVGLILSTAVVAWLAPHFGPVPAKLASIGASFSWNYLFSNFLVFRDRPGARPGADRGIPAPQGIRQDHDGQHGG